MPSPRAKCATFSPLSPLKSVQIYNPSCVRDSIIEPGHCSEVKNCRMSNLSSRLTLISSKTSPAECSDASSGDSDSLSTSSSPPVKPTDDDEVESPEADTETILPSACTASKFSTDPLLSRSHVFDLPTLFPNSLKSLQHPKPKHLAQHVQSPPADTISLLHRHEDRRKPTPLRQQQQSRKSSMVRRPLILCNGIWTSTNTSSNENPWTSAAGMRSCSSRATLKPPTPWSTSVASGRRNAVSTSSALSLALNEETDTSLNGPWHLRESGSEAHRVVAGGAKSLKSGCDASGKGSSNSVGRHRPRTIRSFNARLNSYAQKGNYLEVLSLIEGFHNGKVLVSGPLNTYSYTILVKAYCNAGNLKAARSLLDEMKGFEENQRPNRFTYNTLLNGCVRWNAMKSASEIFTIMEKSNNLDLHPDHVTYTTLIKGFAANGEMESAHKLLSLLKQHPDPSCKPNHVTYNTMIKGYASCADMESAERIVDQMRQQICPQSGKKVCLPDKVTFNTLIGGYTRLGDMKAAESYLALMQNSPQPELRPNQVTYNTMLDGFIRSDQLERAEDLFQKLSCGRIKDVTPSSLTYGSMIGGYMKSGNFAKAELLFMQGQNHRDPYCRPNCSTFVAMISSYAKSGMLDKACQLLQRMKTISASNDSGHGNSHLRLTTTVYNALLSGCVNAGQLDRAQALLAEIQRSGDHSCKPNRQSFNILISGFADMNQVANAEHVLDFMNRHPDPACHPSTATYQHLLRMYRRSGDTSMVEHLMQRLEMSEDVSVDV